MTLIILLINAVLSDKIGSLISMDPSLNKFSSRPKAFIRKDIRINRLPNKGKIIYLLSTLLLTTEFIETARVRVLKYPLFLSNGPIEFLSVSPGVYAPSLVRLGNLM